MPQNSDTWTALRLGDNASLLCEGVSREDATAAIMADESDAEHFMLRSWESELAIRRDINCSQ